MDARGTGRIAALASTTDSLGRAVVATISGSAGVGKTALAVHWAHHAQDRFPDGQLYANLRGYTPAPPARPIEALTGLLGALGVPAGQVPADQDAAAGLYRSLLAGSRMLVLLDNAESSEQVRPLLPAAPACLVLITSRDRLTGLVAHDSAHPIALDMLTPDESQLLLARILGAERVAAEAEATTELARACAHLPLALRIATANLLSRPHRTVARYLTELNHHGRLAGLAAGDDDTSAVRDVFDPSYHRMPHEMKPRETRRAHRQIDQTSRRRDQTAPSRPIASATPVGPPESRGPTI